MNEKIEYLYEDKRVLKIIVNIKLSFSKTIGFLVLSILMSPVVVIITYPLVYGVFSGKIIQLPIRDTLLILLLAIIVDYIGGMAIYQWLWYNFGKEIIILNNKEKVLSYQRLVFGLGSIKKLDYCDISKIAAESECSRYPDYHCYLIYRGKRLNFGNVNTIKNGEKLVKQINKFINR